jgi:hydroxymethylpyrimidine pyrophosphatase-like HAD family hydrolase
MQQALVCETETCIWRDMRNTAAMRCVYLDLDGTLLGHGASLMHDGEGNVTMAGVKAIEACHRAGLEIVMISGRREAQVREDTRLLGGRAYAFESGACLVTDGEPDWLTGDWMPGELTIHEQIEQAGAGQLLLSHYDGLLEHHEPWHTGREVSHLYRGRINAAEATQLLADSGFRTLRLCDNGSVHHSSKALRDLGDLRAYHLVPSGASKVNAVARHMQIRGYRPEDCLSAGDGREDLEIANVVGSTWIMQNALTADPEIDQLAAARPNVRISEEGNGAGVYEAIVTTLAEAR